MNEDKPLFINKMTFNHEKFAEYQMQDAKARYEQEKRRKLTDMAIRNQREPWERETPDLEGIVDMSEQVETK